MEKKTLTTWGLIIVTVLTLAILIVCVSPLGRMIVDGIRGSVPDVSVDEQVNLSSDKRAVSEMNELLIADEKINGKAVGIDAAKAVLDAGGVDVERVAPLSKGFIYYWVSTENRVILFDQTEMKVIYPDSLAERFAEYTEGERSDNWYVLNDKTNEVLLLSEDASSDDLYALIASAEPYQIIKLQSDFEFSSVDMYYDGFPLNDSGITQIDLNGHELVCDTYYKNVAVPVNDSLYISNGTLTVTDAYSSASNYPGITVADGASLTLENVTYKTETSAGIFPAGTASEVNIINSVIETKGMTIGTNAIGTLSNYVVINIESSVIRSSDGSGLIINVPCRVNITNSTIEGDSIGVCLRAGTARIENSVIREYDEDDSWFTDKYGELSTSDIGWGQGNQVQWGGLIIGDWVEGSYSSDATCVLINTVVEAVSSKLPTVYLSQDGEYTTSLTYDEACSLGDIAINSATDITRGTIIVNGEEK